MPYQTGIVNNLAEIKSVFENFLTSNGWVLQTATQVDFTLTSRDRNNYQYGNTRMVATSFPNLPYGATISHSGFTNTAILSSKQSNTSYYANCPVDFSSNSLNANWQAYTKNGITFLPIFTTYNSINIFGGDILKDINTPISSVGSGSESRRYSFQAVKIPNSNFPITYHIMYNENPTVFTMVFTFGVNETYWLTFGMLDKIHPNAYVGGAFYAASDGFMLGIGNRSLKEITMDSFVNISNPSYCGIMLASTAGDSHPSFLLHAEINGLISTDTTYVNGPLANSIRLSANSIIKLFKGMNTWNGQTLLVPMEIEFKTVANLSMLLGHVEHLRFLRIDNYNSGDIITLGSDKWKVFPCVKKNVAARNGASTDHSGTIGFAVRYDGA